VLTLHRIAIPLVLAALLAPPGWCCTFSECPLVARSAAGLQESPCRACCCSRSASKPATSDVATIGRPASVPSECPFRAVMGRLVENDPVRLGDPILAAAQPAGAPEITAVSEPLSWYATVAPPPPIRLTVLCRWLC
jgi:hypothetical protein